MYPQPELSRGVARKAAVRRSIALRRMQCVMAATQAAQPLALFERMVTVWRQLAPFAGVAAVAFGFRRTQGGSPHRGFISTLLRWGPIVAGLLRLYRSTRKPPVVGAPGP
jgi:hypothetical protein